MKSKKLEKKLKHWKIERKNSKKKLAIKKIDRLNHIHTNISQNYQSNNDPGTLALRFTYFVLVFYTF